MQEESNVDLITEVDATIKSVCKIVQERNVPNGEYADTVKVLPRWLKQEFFWLDF